MCLASEAGAEAPALTSMEPAASGGSFTGTAQGCFLCGKMLIAEWELSETGQV